ncbi:hypothetical protein FSARC_3190 [Fusarium sarcochroum]|uniref:Uncharacterized protein n=1 Tax=Fusarium sarcochroum TaxID=1208366 RepID=A0A8H4U4G1_9HYPO|nr:hypothetical protein FSARC_3190 [Fusarium sarcochroum]
MAVRYTADFLLYLRDSPLCTRPPNLPPAEEWMGPPPEPNRTQNKVTGDRPRSNDNPLLDQTNRRPGVERHVSRNSANPEDLVFAPPRTAFASARGKSSLEADKVAKESETPGRFGNFRSRNGDLDADRFREGRNNNGFRRGEGEADGWSTVKPRKSFGHEGAERFHGRMGGNFRDDKRQPREQNDRDAPRDRPTRNFDGFTRDRDGDDSDGRARNGLNRTKPEPWYKNESNTATAPVAETTTTPDKRERIDRAKSWRDRDAAADAPDDRHNNNNRTHDRRWGRDRDQRVEREPEWLDEPLEEHPEAHTQQDFQKWMEEMKKAKAGIPAAPSKPANVEAAEAIIEAEKPPVQSAPAVQTGPDKFFMAFGSNAGLDTPGTEEAKEPVSKPKTAGKSSRFTSFFSQPQEEPRGKTEPPTPMTGPPINSGVPLPLPFIGGPAPSAGPDDERQAFQQLLAKLQKQTMSATPPGPSPFAAPQGTPPNAGRPNPITSPESPFQQYGPDRRMDGPLGRPPPHHVQEILAPRPQQQAARPEQLLQDLVGQRQRAPSQGSGRPDAARNNSNTEFLMNLMRAPPDAQRNELLMRMGPQQQKPGHILPQEADFPRDDRGPQRQMRPQPPPGFPMDERFHNPPDADARPNQPTQILQRPPPPPGLDQMPPSWMPGGQMPPPQPRGPMIPPPGLPGGPVGPGGPGPNRNMPMPHMFPPNFPPGAMPPPEAMGGPLPRNMPPPPPGFFGGPPHGFIPPGLGGFNGPPGPDFPGGPFEGRGMPPSGNPGRGAAFGRP